MSSSSHAHSPYPNLPPGQLVEMEEGRIGESVFISSAPPLDGLGEPSRDLMGRVLLFLTGSCIRTVYNVRKRETCFHCFFYSPHFLI